MVSPLTEIHEFSTGITPEKLADGSWVSRGFTGQYMNSTLDEIPYAVERSIANKEFAVAEGSSSKWSTIIGREVGAWSVLAFVTKGRDEKGRGASFYRYFLTSSPNGLAKILAFLKEQENQGQIISFNPFEHRQVNRPHTTSAEPPKLGSDGQIYAEGSKAPDILDARRSYSPEQINQLAKSYSQRNSQPIAWAFNVEALEQPGRFQVIYPASEAASRRIQQSLSVMPAAVSSSIDEQAIKSALKNLINSAQAKSDNFQTLINSLDSVENGLNESEIQTFWTTLFNSQGADNAIRQKIYSHPMVRLLTIRAMILPETLTSLLKWLEQISDRKQQQEQVEVSLALQAQASQFLNRSPSLQYLLLTGVNNLMENVFRRKLSPESSSLLLQSPKSIWQPLLRKQLENTNHDLTLMARQKEMRVPNRSNEQLLTSQVWQTILKGLQIDSSPSATHDPKYLALGKLFSYLDAPVLAACCYQAGRGMVPPDIYEDALRYPNFNKGRPFGIYLRREKTVLETIWAILNTPLGTVVIVCFALVAMLYFFRNPLADFINKVRTPENEVQQVERESEPKVEEHISSLPQESDFLNESELFIGTSLPSDNTLLQKAKLEFGSVICPAIRSLVEEVKKTSQIDSDEEAFKRIVQTLRGPKEITEKELELLNLPTIIAKSSTPLTDKEIERWLALIASYQTREELESDGYLSNPGETYNSLKIALSQPQIDESQVPDSSENQPQGDERNLSQ